MATELEFSKIPLEKLPLRFLQEWAKSGQLKPQEAARIRQVVAAKLAAGERPSTPEEVAAREEARRARRQAEKDSARKR